MGAQTPQNLNWTGAMANRQINRAHSTFRMGAYNVFGPAKRTPRKIEHIELKVYKALSSSHWGFKKACKPRLDNIERQ